MILYPIFMLLLLPKLAISDGEKKGSISNTREMEREEKKVWKKLPRQVWIKYILIGEGDGHLKEWISDPGTGHELFRNLCALRTTGNSKNVKEDEKKGIFKIDSKHQIRIEHDQIDDQLNAQINKKLAEICGPKVNNKLLEELPNYISGIIEERKGAISGHFEQVEIIYEDEHGVKKKTLGLKEIMDKGFEKMPPHISHAFKQLHEILKSIGDEIADGNAKEMIAKLTNKKGPPMPNEMWEMCAVLWEDLHSNRNGKSKTHQTKKNALMKAFSHHIAVAPPTVLAYRRRRKRALGLPIPNAEQRHLIFFCTALFGLVLMPRIFSNGASHLNPFGSAESDMSDVSYFGRMFRVGTGAVLLVSLYAGYVLYGHDRFFPQHGQQEQQQQQEGRVEINKLKEDMVLGVEPQPPTLD